LLLAEIKFPIIEQFPVSSNVIFRSRTKLTGAAGFGRFDDAEAPKDMNKPYESLWTFA
jgi:hypothetical protein